ncbi:GNAT family N-acetyltransferase [Streptobacillus canis]|uniref:GNAT family N-acetyltransferase n=1 Tax=Streptobacillus canis TaxID=2678686 RepID=UPI0018CC3A41|nr:GNAT family N-acetyltransferase [Streptobacillus canis]
MIIELKRLNKDDADEILRIYESNDEYFKICPPEPSNESVLNDMVMIPEEFDINNKKFLGIFIEERLVGVLDLLEGYPTKEVLWIGLLLIDKNFQNKGIATRVLEEFVYNMGYETIRLGYIDVNVKAERFWKKNGFAKEIKKVDNVIVVEKM